MQLPRKLGAAGEPASSPRRALWAHVGRSLQALDTEAIVVAFDPESDGQIDVANLVMADKIMTTLKNHNKFLKNNNNSSSGQPSW